MAPSAFFGIQEPLTGTPLVFRSQYDELVQAVSLVHGPETCCATQVPLLPQYDPGAHPPPNMHACPSIGRGPQTFVVALHVRPSFV